MSAFPPIRTQPSIPLSTSTALQHLQSYLAAAQTSPYLLPNAILQSDGPRAHSESASNLVIHNLKRVEAGLRGEWLAPSLDLDGSGSAVGDFGVAGGGGSYVGRVVDVVEEEEEEQATVVAEEEGWQDLDEYRREQSVGSGEGELREEVAVVAVEMEVDVEGESAREALRIKKMERKSKKHERIVKERKERHKKSLGKK